MPYLPWVMSKFLILGFSLEQVVAMATINPSKIINRAPGIGTLQIGAPGVTRLQQLFPVAKPTLYLEAKRWGDFPNIDAAIERIRTLMLRSLHLL